MIERYAFLNDSNEDAHSYGRPNADVPCLKEKFFVGVPHLNESIVSSWPVHCVLVKESF